MTKAELIAKHSAKAGLRSKINAKCIECIYDDAGGAGGNWRQQVTACTSTGCPLYSVRPVSSENERSE